MTRSAKINHVSTQNGPIFQVCFIITHALTLFPLGAEYFSFFVLILSFLAVIYGSLITLRQVDLKCVVAYSSVAHMGLVILGLFSMTIEGKVGGLYLMFAHGLVLNLEEKFTSLMGFPWMDDLVYKKLMKENHGY